MSVIQTLLNGAISAITDSADARQKVVDELPETTGLDAETIQALLSGNATAEQIAAAPEGWQTKLATRIGIAPDSISAALTSEGLVEAPEEPATSDSIDAAVQSALKAGGAAELKRGHEIHQRCQAASRPDLSMELFLAGLSVEDAQQKLVARMASEQEHLSTHHDPGQSEQTMAVSAISQAMNKRRK